MEHSRYAKAIARAAVCSALMLAALRAVLLQTAFDDSGLLPRGSSALPVTVLAAAAFFAGLCFLALRLNRLPGTEACFSGASLPRVLGLAAALLVLLGALLTLWRGDPALEQRLIAWGGLAAGLCLFAVALADKRGPGFFWLRLVPALYTGMTLVLHFRDWSHDPMVFHIAPPLLTWTCGMVEMMLLTAFPLQAGHRRSAVLFGLSVGVFACMALPDYLLGFRSGLANLLIALGVVLWCVTAAFELLRDRVQQEEAPSEEAPADAPADAPAELPEEAPEAIDN